MKPEHHVNDLTETVNRVRHMFVECKNNCPPVDADPEAIAKWEGAFLAFRAILMDWGARCGFAGADCERVAVDLVDCQHGHVDLFWALAGLRAETARGLLTTACWLNLVRVAGKYELSAVDFEGPLAQPAARLDNPSSLQGVAFNGDGLFSCDGLASKQQAGDEREGEMEFYGFILSVGGKRPATIVARCSARKNRAFGRCQRGANHGQIVVKRKPSTGRRGIVCLFRGLDS